MTPPAHAEPIAVHEMAGAVSRRRAMQLMAASLALGTAACSRPRTGELLPYVDMPEAGRGATPAFYASAFVRDGYAHGVLIGTVDGRPIKIEGNPRHPSSRGGSDAFLQASILQLWDPDRSQEVHERLPTTPTADKTAAVPSSWPAFETAWRSRAARLARRDGEGLALLTPSFASPAAQAGLEAVLQCFPAARWFRHAPLLPRAARRGAELAFGRELDMLLRLDRARLVVAFDADPFSDGPAAVRHAADWAERRAREPTRLRLVAFETTPGLFGARADERTALAPADIEALIEAVGGRVLDASAPGGAEARAERVAAALRDAGADALVVAGPNLSARAHATVCRINARLGAWGRTLEAIEPVDALPGRDPGSIDELASRIEQGTADTLLVVGGNPAYDAPADSRFAELLERVPFSAHLGLYRDETARRCVWQLPASHDYESWADARGHDGTATIVQPAIAPLYDTRSAIECYALFAGDPLHDGYALVRRHWQEAAGLADAAFEAMWTESVRQGVVAGSEAPRFDVVAAAAARARTPAVVGAEPAVEPAVDPADATGLVAVFVADAAVGDGGFANNGWLQELPRPFSKIVWGNAVQLGPRTAAALGLANGDGVRLEVQGRSVEAPVWIETRHAEGVASLPLGYGRQSAGRVGNGVGFDAYAIRPARGGAVPLRLQKTGRRHALATTQQRLSQEGRELARTVPPGGAVPAEAAAGSLYPPRSFPEHAWAMVIDLDACIGCNACTVACQAENNIPVVGAEEVRRGREMHWIRVDHYAGDGGAATGGPSSIFQPVPCMHCENAPCEVVCPVGAAVHDSEGLNLQVYNRCVGTRFCSANCPYKVRRFNFFQYADQTTESLKAMRNPDVTVRARGVMEKCTYCVQRLSRARIGAQESGRPIADGSVLTACQTACPTRAIHFGDGNDAESDVVRQRASPRHYALLGELNTRPRTTYLARVDGTAAGGTKEGS